MYNKIVQNINILNFVYSNWKSITENVYLYSKVIFLNSSTISSSDFSP